ncbi:hypothetical protein CEUSTIGMA_g13802.t1 [Chlamydomonas eustigma]|uniref:Uncharacterized protein n=1 Tax=Chlamydomonas eustigma TaxID=1157962 RepID=A0A250XTH3_9CHLO|nr:hypothetical protein CEUSTIGMA_g13802.t1 [Chlamydomonas eustigma]|eukprot:GAX86391.1 hypothetical protein CEUSTIGMA_g13802.t1 [Chlamydomonas eustigma]
MESKVKNKRKVSFVEVEENLDKRYHPGPTFSASLNAPHFDTRGLQDGTKELWLIQMPKQMNVQGLHGLTVEMDMRKVEEHQAATLGSMGSRDGSKLQLVQESNQLSDQLYVVAGREAAPAAMGLFPVSRRITLEKVLAVQHAGICEIQETAADPIEETEIEGEIAKQIENTAGKSKKEKKKEKKQERRNSSGQAT